MITPVLLNVTHTTYEVIMTTFSVVLGVHDVCKPSQSMTLLRARAGSSCRVRNAKAGLDESLWGVCGTILSISSKSGRMRFPKVVDYFYKVGHSPLTGQPGVTSTCSILINLLAVVAMWFAHRRPY